MDDVKLTNHSIYPVRKISDMCAKSGLQNKKPLKRSLVLRKWLAIIHSCLMLCSRCSWAD
jgi:hypothetical protein